MRIGENDFGRILPSRCPKASTFRRRGASYLRWIVRRVVRNNGFIFVYKSHSGEGHDRLVATAKVLQQKRCDKRIPKMMITATSRSVKRLTCTFFFTLQTKIVDSPVDRWTVIVDRRSNISIVLVDNREMGEDF